jgi:translation initiation factor IF-2
MTNETDSDTKKPLSLGGRGKLELKRPGMAGDGAPSVRQSFPHGRTKTVQVEVRKVRTIATPAGGPARPEGAEPPPTPVEASRPAATVALPPRRPRELRELTEEERAARARAVEQQRIDAVRRAAEEDVRRKSAEEARLKAVEEEKRQRAEEERLRAEAALRAEAEAKLRPPPVAVEEPTPGEAVLKPPAGLRPEQIKVERETTSKVAVAADQAAAAQRTRAGVEEEEDSANRARRPARVQEVRRPAPVRRGDQRRNAGKLTVTQALDAEALERTRSLASVRRQRERDRLRGLQRNQDKVFRDVVVPDSITVQELASRMAERVGDVVKALMRMGVMATMNQAIDADTAELIVQEFGHSAIRQSESDVEIGIKGDADMAEALVPRPPVVTIMGHVDHGKTSLLDALRQTDVVAQEAGGITQHIGAYQVNLAGGQRITFIDTPGHEAFTQMRARGANVTDIVVLVVAADDGIMPQTVEAIQHAKAAKVPIIVAINKCDKPQANPDRVRNELLSHEMVVEKLGGDVLDVEVSALTRQGLDALEEAILLQAEVLDLKANPDRQAEGAIVESRLDRGRGPVATVLIQRGTLAVGDIFVAGHEWGRVRALVDDRGQSVTRATPAMPVEVVGLQGTPTAGEELLVVETEARAREIADFRQRRKREEELKLTQRGTIEQLMSKIASGEAREMPVVVKSDVQGSLEAITASIGKIGTDEVRTRVLYAGVGAVSEADVTLAKASSALIIAFNVRANAQAREMAKRDGVEIRYYSIIYNVVDDVKAALTGMLAPTVRENFLGYAEIRQLFEITKVGKVAGCRVTEGQVKRGAKVRLLRDNVVIHEGTLKTLRRFKDEVREVQSGFECGMAFENYQDIREGDVIECFEMVEEARSL